MAKKNSEKITILSQSSQSITQLKHSNAYQRMTKRSRLYGRYEDIFNVDCGQWPSKKIKARLLLRKLGQTEHNRFLDLILLKPTRDLDFSEINKLLSELFRPNTTLYSRRNGMSHSLF